MNNPPSQKLKDNLSKVKNIVFVLSGKGGVGKSTFSTQIALTLANQLQKQQKDSKEKIKKLVALLDVDITGPSVPKILSLDSESVYQGNNGFIPICGVPDKSDETQSKDEGASSRRKCLNLRTMSIGFLMQRKNEAVIWRGPKKHSMIQSFLEDVDWNASIQSAEESTDGDSTTESCIEYLVIDTPPGTSDEHISCAQLLSGYQTHAIIVTTPQEVALSDVRREVNFCKKLNINLLGVVENMSGFACPCCHEITNIFSKGGGEKLAKESNVDFLGAVPIDPNIASGMDEGKDFVDSYKDSTSALVIGSIVQKIRSKFEEESESE